MKLKIESLFWFVFCFLLSAVFIIQTAFLPNHFLQIFLPFLTWPFITFIFLYFSGLSSLGFIVFISLLSNVFSSVPVFNLFLIYISLFFSAFIIKNFFFSKSLYSILVFAFSFLFPHLLDFADDYSIQISLLSEGLYFVQAFASFIFSLIAFPYLKNYIPKTSSF